MAQMGRTAVKNLEAPRPLKSTLKQTHVHVPVYEVQSIEELITLTENVAASLDNGCNNADGMNALLANLRLHGPQLELVSKDTLDRAFVIFRNASQDERLNIMTRLNLLELIELRAKSWQVSDGTNTYYKHKATNVEPDDPSSLLSTSPPGMSLGAQQQIIPSLSPGELIRTSGKFPKPTKIPGKTYCKDEIVIRNADSGKVMGIKGRRVHMIEELSETVISFQRVNPGAKERLVQITGPNEDKINYAKQLIEDTIRRNASPVRLETSQDGSCSSLASSASDDGMVAMPRRSVPDSSSSSSGVVVPGGNVQLQRMNSMGGGNPNGGFMPSPQGPPSAAGLNLNLNNMYQQQQQQVQQQVQAQQHQHQQYTHPKLVRNGSQNNGQAGMLLHSFSQNDASLGEYKYTVNVGRHSIKITGDCFDLVRVAKLVLDDYFSSNEFLASVEMGSSFDLPSSLASPVTPMAGQHQLITGSPFVDSGVGLDAMAIGGGGGNCIEVDDDVFIVDPPTLTSSSSSNSTLVTSTPSSASNNGLSRSRRSHFSRKDSAPEGIKDGSRDDSTPVRIVHEYERLIYYSKSPHSWALPRDWLKICDKLPYLVRNKDVNDDKGRFNGDKFLEMKKQSTLEDGGTGGAGDTSGESAERDEVPSSSTTPKTTTADGESGSGTTSTTTATATTTIASESKEG
ncbi:eukaryotic translation initiation factor 4E-binding protein Mextli isoform X3 [Culex quinquefasciatus]|uniref:eukaryotic translation initiation factor 4E-binding protein Mextli isoform X3 n=1 Tax=Culex quinquefasciatus TaxID=7176 RepID=UPI0018E2B533|nr:eukaryotic translation initiation factor 4E-binding protein Mextli isoform X3 [Culex quinquefasciatus]